jgi:hypothetical protein
MSSCGRSTSEISWLRNEQECLFRLATNRKGEHIYHLPGQLNYAQINMTKGPGERWFCTELKPMPPDGAKPFADRGDNVQSLLRHHDNALFRVGNLAPMPDVFYPAPVVRNLGGEPELMRWGMPPPPAGGYGHKHPQHTGGRSAENRCLVPANCIAE